MSTSISNTQPKFVPRQAQAILKDKVGAYERTGGIVTLQFAEACVNLSPPFTADAVIHDNACGSGHVAKQVVATNPPSGISIKATDIDETFVTACQANTQASGWPVETAVMRSESLDFPDDYFKHSIMNIAIFMTTNSGLDAAKEIYRTLKPGGTAVVNCWQSMAWLQPIMEVHIATRPNRPWPLPVISWSDGTQLRKIMEEAGFKSENIKATTSDAYAITTDLHDWAETTWAYLGGMPGWAESDEEKWDEAVTLLEQKLRKAPDFSESESGEIRLAARQNIVVATK